MRKWFIFGDSHVSAFQAASVNGLINRPCEFLPVGGATSIGLRNPNSLTNAVAHFEAALIPLRTDVIPVAHLGEVDCGFVIWWRAEKYGESIEQQMQASVEGYFDLVDKLTSIGYGSIVITGATMPTIPDNQEWGDVANARREVKASLVDRTALTLIYNGGLCAGAENRGLPFIDISDTILDPTTRCLSVDFRHPDPTDHHLNPELVGPLWAARLNELDI